MPRPHGASGGTDHLNGPPEVLRDPRLAGAGVAWIDPDMRQPRRAVLDGLEHQRTSREGVAIGPRPRGPSDEPVRGDQ